MARTLIKAVFTFKDIAKTQRIRNNDVNVNVNNLVRYAVTICGLEKFFCKTKSNNGNKKTRKKGIYANNELLGNSENSNPPIIRLSKIKNKTTKRIFILIILLFI